MHDKNSLAPVKRGLVGFLSRLGRNELSVLLSFSGIAIGILIFAELADQVIDGGTTGIDRRLLLAFRIPGTLAPVGSEAVQVAARDITALGGVMLLMLITGVTAIFLALDGKSHMAVFLCAAVSSGMLLSDLLKSIFQRPRPELVPYLSQISNTSFPSGHSTMSAVTYLTLGALLARSQERQALRAYFLIVAVLLTMMVGVSRVYLGVHWPSDVLAGWIAGSVWAAICWVTAEWLQRRRQIERQGEH